MHPRFHGKLTLSLFLIALLSVLPPLASCGFGEGAAAPEADFAVNITSGSCPLLVQFTAKCSGEVTDWAWDFDCDGRVDSTERDPS